MTSKMRPLSKNLFVFVTLSSVLLLQNQQQVFAAPLVPGTPVQIIYTKFGNPLIDPLTNPNWFNNMPVNYDSPDGSDIVFLGANPSTVPTPGVPYRNTLMVCDGEVDEMGAATWAQLSNPPGFSGFNLFEMNPIGTGLNTFTTTTRSRSGWSNEPVGCSYNQSNGHLFVSDDDQRKVFEINPGADKQLFTADDTRTSFLTSAFGDNDPEGLAYNPVDGALYITSGAESEVFKVSPGSDGLFNGVPPTGDDVVTHFDTASQGVFDPEGIAFDGENRLYVLGQPQTRIGHFYTTGPLIRMIDTSAFHYPSGPKKPAGLTVGPSGTLFISSRDIDNSSNPNENDGKVYEMAVPALGSPPPAVAAGPDLVLYRPNVTADLNGAAVNTGTVAWSMVSGPGTVTFGSPNSSISTANFSADGSYVLRLSDSNSAAFDDVIVQVRQPFNGALKTVYISTLNSTDTSGIFVGNEDIIAYDTATHTWSMVFDGSDVGLGASGVNVDAFKRMEDGTILLSTDVPVTLPIVDPMLGTVVNTLIDDSDIVRFIPTSLGGNTAGSYQWFFDGSDVGLDLDSEDIDSIGFLPDGRLAISITGSSATGGVPGLPTVQDEDLIAFTNSDLGANTVGTWSVHFDGSDVGLSDGGDAEDVMGAWFDQSKNINNDIYLTTRGAFSVTGASGGGDDIFRCTPTSTGTTTACSYSFVWDGGGNGLQAGVVVDGFDLVPANIDNIPPTANLTAPANASVVSGTVTVSANASDNVGVVGLQFQVNGNPLGNEIEGSGPYSYNWDTTTATSGVYTLTAVARDATGNIGTSGGITVTVDNGPLPDTQPPTVALTAPAANAVVSGVTTVSANASDNVGVVGVQFKLDNTNLGGEIVGAGPYVFAWNTSAAAAGAHTLTAVARDAAGNIATSSTVGVTVNNTPSDTTPPTTSITAPTGGSTVSGTITLVAAASDNIGVVGVQFKLDGVTNIGSEITTAPFSTSWNTASVTNGNHTLTSVARDAAGNVATSSSVSVTVNNTVSPGGLTHHWKFDETSGITALDSVGTNVANFSSPLWVVGKKGNAVSLNGTNASGTAGTIDFGLSNFTVAHWVNVTAFKNFAGIFNNRSSVTGNVGFQTRTDGTNTFTALIDFGATSKSVAVANVAVGTWNHVAVTVERAGLMKLYLNGVLAGQVDISTFSTTSITNTDAVRIGRDQASNFYSGALDDLQLYNAALSASEIQTIYNNQAP
jgi:hypothetical protein